MSILGGRGQEGSKELLPATLDAVQLSGSQVLWLPMALSILTPRKEG